MPSTTQKPRVLLFDIGGVCVVSPMQAIRDYEIANDIPSGYVNYAISNAGSQGAWARLERGEILMDEAFFAAFQEDLSHEQRWQEFWSKQKSASSSSSSPSSSTTSPAPPVPHIDAKWLFHELHRVARATDPHMYPALQVLRRLADQTRDTTGELIIAALSNTSIYPSTAEYADANAPDSDVARLKGLFDIFVSSAHVGMRKPEPEIYRYALTRLHEYCKTRYQSRDDRGVAPADVLFLDDIGTNLRAARALGFRTIKVQLGRADLAVAELEKILGVRLTDGEGTKDRSRL